MTYPMKWLDNKWLANAWMYPEMQIISETKVITILQAGLALSQE